MVSVCPVVPNRTSWWATSPRSRTEWMGIPAAPRAPRRPADGERARRVRCPLGRGRRQSLGGVHGGARGRVGLAVVVQLDDLRRARTGRGQLGQPDHQHRPDREVGGDEAVGRRGERIAELGQRGVAQAARADDGVHAVRRTPAGVGEGGRGDGEVDRDLDARVGHRVGGRRGGDTLRAGRIGEPRVDGGDQLELGVGGDRTADLATHPPRGTEDSTRTTAVTVAAAATAVVRAVSPVAAASAPVIRRLGGGAAVVWRCCRRGRRRCWPWRARGMAPPGGMRDTARGTHRGATPKWQRKLPANWPEDRACRSAPFTRFSMFEWRENRADNGVGEVSAGRGRVGEVSARRGGVGEVVRACARVGLTPPSGRRGPRGSGLTTASVRGAASSRAATRRMSSVVTVANDSVTSSTDGTPPCSSWLRPMRCIRAPESSRPSAIEPTIPPVAISSSRSVTPSAQPRHLAGDHAQRLGGPRRGGAGVEAQDAGIVEAGAVGVHRVGETATLADLLEQPARRPATEDLREAASRRGGRGRGG